MVAWVEDGGGVGMRMVSAMVISALVKTEEVLMSSLPSSVWAGDGRPPSSLLAPSHQQHHAGSRPQRALRRGFPLLRRVCVFSPWWVANRGHAGMATDLEAAAVLRFLRSRRCFRRSSGSSIASRSGTGSFRFPRRFAVGGRCCPPPSEHRPVCTDPRLSLREPPVRPCVSMLLLWTRGRTPPLRQRATSRTRQFLLTQPTAEAAGGSLHFF